MPIMLGVDDAGTQRVMPVDSGSGALKVGSGRMTLGACGRLTVGATAVRGTSVACHGVVIKALCSGHQIHVGTADTVTTTVGGFQLDDKESINVEVRNLNELYFISDVAAQAITYMAYTY
jgi:hypothetical protein